MYQNYYRAGQGVQGKRLREMENGKWKMENGFREMENVFWEMENGFREMENGFWEMGNGKWKMVLTLKTKFIKFDIPWNQINTLSTFFLSRLN